MDFWTFPPWTFHGSMNPPHGSMETREYGNFCNQPTLHIKKNGKVLLLLLSKFFRIPKIENMCMCM